MIIKKIKKQKQQKLKKKDSKCHNKTWNFLF